MCSLPCSWPLPEARERPTCSSTRPSSGTGIVSDNLQSIRWSLPRVELRTERHVCKAENMHARRAYSWLVE